MLAYSLFIIFFKAYFSNSGIILLDILISQLDKLGIRVTSFRFKE